MRGRDYWAYHRATGPLMRLYIHLKKRSATAGPLLTGPPGKLPVLPMACPPLAVYCSDYVWQSSHGMKVPLNLYLFDGGVWEFDVPWVIN